MSPRAGAREAIRDPISLAMVSITTKPHHILRSLVRLLLEPCNGVGAVLTTQGTGEFD